jgi:hypothetical protein
MYLAAGIADSPQGAIVIKVTFRPSAPGFFAAKHAFTSFG